MNIMKYYNNSTKKWKQCPECFTFVLQWITESEDEGKMKYTYIHEWCSELQSEVWTPPTVALLEKHYEAARWKPHYS